LSRSTPSHAHIKHVNPKFHWEFKDILKTTPNIHRSRLRSSRNHEKGKLIEVNFWRRAALQRWPHPLHRELAVGSLRDHVVNSKNADPFCPAADRQITGLFEDRTTEVDDLEI